MDCITLTINGKPREVPIAIRRGPTRRERIKALPPEQQYFIAKRAVAWRRRCWEDFDLRR